MAIRTISNRFVHKATLVLANGSVLCVAEVSSKVPRKFDQSLDFKFYLKYPVKRAVEARICGCY